MRLGLPAEGPGSVAGPGRRLAAVIVDWLCCLLISRAFFDADPWATLAVFALIQVVTVGTMGFGPGHRLFRMRVIALGGGWPGPGKAAVRTAMLCLFIPAVVFDQDRRGLHDRAAGTVLVTT